MTTRRCENCKDDISHKHSRAVFCSKRCRDAPRFHGTFCVQCGEKLFVKRENAKSIKTCSGQCRVLLKYPDFKEDYFATPNLENSYWAGFIAADGCIHIDQGYSVLTVSLKSEDVGHLQKLQSSIGGGTLTRKTIRLASTGKTYPYDSFRLYAENICNDLTLNYNITPRKSLTLQPPDLTGDCARAFIAGYIDGDGSYKRDRNRPCLDVLGTYEMILWISHVYGIDRPPRKQNNVYLVSFNGNDAIRVRDSFSNLDIPLLERKKNRWEELGVPNMRIL